MANQTALRHALAEFTRTILDQYDTGELLYRLSDQVVEVLGIVGAGVSVGDSDGVLRFVAAAGGPSAAVESLQEAMQEGPCSVAYHTGEEVAVQDLADEVWRRRWPRFAAGALDLGVRAIAGIPMAAGERTIGALNLYREAVGPWDDEELESARILADVATGYLLNAVEVDRSRRVAAQLQQALDSRVVLEQAKGVLVGRHGIAPDAAFQRLRQHARSQRIKVHDAARAVIAGLLDV